MSQCKLYLLITIKLTGHKLKMQIVTGMHIASITNDGGFYNYIVILQIVSSEYVTKRICVYVRFCVRVRDRNLFLSPDYPRPLNGIYCLTKVSIYSIKDIFRFYFRDFTLK